VAVLIFVFDVESEALKKELNYFTNCMESLLKHSPDARVFCLIHKMDLLPEDRAQTVYQRRRAELEKLAYPLRVKCFKTSIWDETLYKAWSAIVYALIPNIKHLEQHVHAFCKLCEADEVVLFERATFLVISHASSTDHQDAHRFEKISNIVKQFKLSCSKSGAQFLNMQVHNSQFSAYTDILTDNAFVLITFNKSRSKSSVGSVTTAAVRANIQEAKRFFQPLLE